MYYKSSPETYKITHITESAMFGSNVETKVETKVKTMKKVKHDLDIFKYLILVVLLFCSKRKNLSYLF